jgi:hypothetical protein
LRRPERSSAILIEATGGMIADEGVSGIRYEIPLLTEFKPCLDPKPARGFVAAAFCGKSSINPEISLIRIR